MFKEGLFTGKRILITGGGTGLGKEIAAKYLELGAEVWIAGRPFEAANAKLNPFTLPIFFSNSIILTLEFFL